MVLCCEAKANLKVPLQLLSLNLQCSRLYLWFQRRQKARKGKFIYTAHSIILKGYLKHLTEFTGEGPRDK